MCRHLVFTCRHRILHSNGLSVHTEQPAVASTSSMKVHEDSSPEGYSSCLNKSLESNSNLNNDSEIIRNIEDVEGQITSEQHNLPSFSFESSSDSSSDIDNEDLINSYTDQEEAIFQNDDLITTAKRMSHVIIFPEPQLSTRDVSLMVMAFSIRFHLTYEARDALFEMSKVFAGPTFENWNTSKYVINKLYDPPDEVIKLCFMCTKCYEPLLPPISKKNFKKCHVKCICNEEYDLSTLSSNYVIAVDLKYQISMLLKNEEIKRELLKNIRNISERKNISEDISDVYDSTLYKEIQKKFSHASHLVTYNYSTDGGPLCNSETKSFWPLQIVLNELSPKTRFKYPLLAGISIDNKEPSPEFMNAYLKHFVNQSEELSEKGLEITDDNGTPVLLTIVPLCCSLDSVARPITQNRLQFNGYFGCSWCYDKGVYESHAVRYPVRSEDSTLRTDESHRKHYADKQLTQFPTVKGVKGFSVLLTLSLFDMVWGFPVDYLHADLLGVVKYLWDVMVQTKVITADGIREINKRILNMTPPHEIHRLPRALKVKAKWKASEWRSWLLFYSVVCLKGLVPAEVFKNYQLLVDSVFILLQESITKKDLITCEEKLLIFVVQCQEMYGIRVMTFNIHSLLHLVESVRRTGPLWSSSTFCFESAIFYLKRAITSPTGRYDQIAKRTLQRLTFNETCQELASTDSCKRYCAKLFSHPEAKNVVQSTDDVLLFGPIGCDENGLQLFDRCIYRSSPFHSVKYRRPKKTVDTMVRLVTNKIGEIQHFQLKNGRTYVLLRLFMEIHDELLTVRHIRKVICTDEIVEVPIESIKQKLMFLAPDNDSTYISELPNKIEIQ